MCLTTNDLTVKTATKPIVCYKAGESMSGGGLGGFTKATTYYPGETSKEVKVDIEIPLESTYGYVNPGYHSYNSYRRIKKLFKHSAIGIFIIPSGAQYVDGWFNNSKDQLNRVSSQIKYLCPATFWNRLKIKLGIIKTT